MSTSHLESGHEGPSGSRALQEPSLDTQVIELLGRSQLIDQLLRAGLEVALPKRDRGVDLVAYVDLAAQVDRFAALPIQMKAASKTAFSLNRKYARISGLILAYVWNVNDPKQTVIYALTYDQALSVAKQAGWTKTASWAKGSYSTSRPSMRIIELLEPFQMTPDRWRELVVGAASTNEGGGRGR